jgi:predicted nucleic acid-binding protein
VSDSALRAGRTTVPPIEALVLDANILIAFLDADDFHHTWTTNFLVERVASTFAASAINVAEALVYPALNGVLERAKSALATLELLVTDVAASDADALARLRASTRLRMPDACALLAAQEQSAALVTFDQRLASAARTLGLVVFDGK